MLTVEYVKFDVINPNDFLPLLNKLKIREHLIQHELFDKKTTAAWMRSKMEVNTRPGCKVRAIRLANQLIGWCGIQFENGKFEIAIVIDDSVWGIGVKIFHEIMNWAKVMGHEEIYIHFLHTRPRYKFLQKMSINIYESELYGSKFNTYQLAVK
jgi:hypothetical protein